MRRVMAKTLQKKKLGPNVVYYFFGHTFSLEMHSMVHQGFGCDLLPLLVKLQANKRKNCNCKSDGRN